MPVPITKYLCKFKCGKNAVAHEGKAALHESNCWKNPENKTCKTCSNEIYEKEDNNIFRGCKNDLINETLDELNGFLKGDNAMHVRPIQNCPYWNKKEDEHIEVFVSKLMSKDLLYIPYADNIKEHDIIEINLKLNPSNN